MSHLLAEKRAREAEFRAAAGADLFPPGALLPEAVAKEQLLLASLARRSIGCHRIFADILIPGASSPSLT